jgi:uncharacterized surface protein with fasciclin (FAS1) repeats
MAARGFLAIRRAQTVSYITTMQFERLNVGYLTNNGRRFMLRIIPGLGNVAVHIAGTMGDLAGKEVVSLTQARPTKGWVEMADIVDTAVSAGNFKTLVAAVKAADLVDALKGEGPLTVFAPTDDAFAKLPEGTVDSLLNDVPRLKDILLYHVVDGKHMAADVAKMTSVKTLQGQSAAIDASAGVKVDGATVVQADLEVDNGVIHVIDSVILPK